jgi:hypothetical protein
MVPCAALAGRSGPLPCARLRRRQRYGLAQPAHPGAAWRRARACARTATSQSTAEQPRTVSQRAAAQRRLSLSDTPSRRAGARQGQAFGDVFPRFPNAVVLGVSNLRSGHTRINPPAALRLEAGDALARPAPPARPGPDPAARRASSACGLLEHAAPARICSGHGLPARIGLGHAAPARTGGWQLTTLSLCPESRKRFPALVSTRDARIFQRKKKGRAGAGAPRRW